MTEIDRWGLCSLVHLDGRYEVRVQSATVATFDSEADARDAWWVFTGRDEGNQ
jgi:hypothetical protein